MIYSNDINKVCGLCRHADTLPDNDAEMYCTLKGCNTDRSAADCGRFEYDIFKKTVHRKRRLDSKFSAADFSID